MHQAVKRKERKKRERRVSEREREREERKKCKQSVGSGHRMDLARTDPSGHRLT